MAITKKPCVNNDNYSYSGREQTPLGLGYAAECEEVGKKMNGRDGKTYIVSVKNNKKIWMRMITDDEVELKKDSPVITNYADDVNQLEVDNSSSDEEKEKEKEKDINTSDEEKDTTSEKEDINTSDEEKDTSEKKKPIRKAPADKANGFPIGFQKKGNDGNTYEISINKNGIKRWTKVNVNIIYDEVESATQMNDTEEMIVKSKKSTRKTKKTNKTSIIGGDDDTDVKEVKKEKTKRAPTTYNLFIKYQMNEIRKNNSEIMPKDCMKLATAKWREMSDEEKEEFKNSL